jgi:hypothetical protein
MSYTLWRYCPRTGFRETLNYFGPIRNIPKGWRRCNDR